MTVRIVRDLFQVVALLYVAADAIVAPAAGARRLVPINTLDLTRSQSLAVARLPYRAAYFVCFSPAFIFANLPRGPPAPT